MTRQEQDRIVHLASKLDIDCTTYDNYPASLLYGRLTNVVAVDNEEDVDKIIVYYNYSLHVFDENNYTDVQELSREEFHERLESNKKGNGRVFKREMVNGKYLIY